MTASTINAQSRIPSLAPRSKEEDMRRLPVVFSLLIASLVGREATVILSATAPFDLILIEGWQKSVR